MNKKEIKDNSGNKEKIKNEKIDNEKINNENQVEQIKENKKINNEKNNNKKNKKYFSLLRKKEFEKDEIWPISKFVRVFFELKKLSGNYQNSKKEKIMENIIKEREKELTFEPDFNETANYFKKNEKDEDLHNTSTNSNISKKSKKKKHDFNKLYEEYMIKKQMHEKALVILRENKQKRDNRMYTYKPKINKDYIIKNRNKTPEISCNRNEFLYNLNKDILNNKKERINKEEKEFKSKYPFKPNISNNDLLKNKSFKEGYEKMPKGSDIFIKRNRSVIQFKKREKTSEQNKIIGLNYEKIKNKKIYLPRIKDLEPSSNLVEHKKVEIKDNKNNLEINNNENDIFFTIQIRTSKGRIKPLKIYINNNPIETINNFCKINKIKKGTREKIIKKCNEFKKVYNEIKSEENEKTK